MPLLKYFFFVGLLLTFSLYRWSEYLAPSAPKAESLSAKRPAMGAEEFRPTPAPPIIEAAEIPPPIEAPPASAEATKAHVETKAARHEPKARKTRPTARRLEESRIKLANDGAVPRLLSFFNLR